MMGELLRKICQRLSIQGGLIIAHEGINGTVCGHPEKADEFVSEISSIPTFSGIDIKYSVAENCPFHRMRIRIRPEIITMGIDGVNPVNINGVHIEAKDWNKLISSNEVTVVDTRNDYEINLGTFRGAMNPHTTKFSDFPNFVRENLWSKKSSKLALFCTGGIRCEKACSFLRREGFQEVYQLKGGILKYLEDIPAEDSLWSGECYVFDDRVGVRHGLETCDLVLCRGCRHVLTHEDRQHPEFLEGVYCPYCFKSLSEATIAANKERHLQIQLAALRAERHLGQPHPHHREA